MIIDKNKDIVITMAIGNLFSAEEKSNHTLAIKGLKNEALHISANGVTAAIKAMRDRKDRRKTGESQDDYDDDKYADEPDFKKKSGSSIGWDTDNDGLGGQ